MVKFNYDQTDVQICYEESRRLPEETLTLWLETISKYVPQDLTKTIMDLGCGTGRFMEGLSDHFKAIVYGIDPSRKMLTVARQSLTSPHVGFIRGSAESIPLDDKVADLVFLSMVYHHIQDRSEAIREFKRILRMRGFLCIRTSTRESMDTYRWLGFFPKARQIELSRTSSRRGITDFLQDHGFDLKGHTVVHHLFADNFHHYFEKISLRGLSSLQAIRDDEFKEGLIGLKKYCQEQKTGDAVFEDIDLFVFRLRLSPTSQVA